MIALLIAGAVAMTVSLFGTRFLIEALRRRAVSQPILAAEGRVARAPQHQHKAGTPTMGGLMIVVAAVVGYAAAHVRVRVVFTDTAMLVVAAMAGAGLVGFLDDAIKVVNRRNLGLTARAKMLGLVAVATAWAVATQLFTDVSTRLSFTRELGVDLGPVGWCVLAVVVIIATSNAVNVTDGLDGLAGGSAILCFAAYVVIAFTAFRNPGLYGIRHGLDLAIVAVAMLGATLGFLWWNAAPARIFMGDTGSLALGTALACLALATNTMLLLPIIGALYVMEAGSVILQVAVFKASGRKRRLFRMSPIHHHFEQLAWPETTIIIRFWILSGIATAIALGLFYADFVAQGGAG